jgi:hypothetical protein
MSRFVNWYTVELERLLKGRLPSAQVAETLAEVEAHLTDSAEELAPSCVHGEDPEALAIERFGSPGKIAYHLINEHGRRPYWRTAVPLVVWVLGAVAFGVAGAGGPLTQGVFALIHAAMWVCLTWFLWTGLKSRRVQTGAVTCAACVVLAGTSAVLPVYFTLADGKLLDRGQLPGTVQDLRTDSQKLERQDAWLDRGIKAFAQNDPRAVPAEFRVGQGFRTYANTSLRVDNEGIEIPITSLPRQYAPGEPVPQTTGIQCSSVGLGNGTAGDFADARKFWEEMVPPLRDNCEAINGRIPRRITDLTAAMTLSDVGRWWRDLPVACYAGGVFWLFAVGLHVASVAVGRLSLAAKLVRRQYA